MEFAPADFKPMAGLIRYFNASKFHYLHVSTDAGIGKHIGIMSCEVDLSLKTSYPIGEARVPLPDQLTIRLRMQVDHTSLRF